jgi:hypothetical protein
MRGEGVQKEGAGTTSSFGPEEENGVRLPRLMRSYSAGKRAGKNHTGVFPCCEFPFSPAWEGKHPYLRAIMTIFIE